MIATPWLPRSVGAVSHAVVELVDLYPTILDFAGAPTPRDAAPDGPVPLEGVSLVPVLADGAAVKQHAFSQYPRRVLDTSKPWHSGNIDHHDPSEFTHMGCGPRTASATRNGTFAVWICL